MKTTMTMLKAGLVGLFFMATFMLKVSAQTPTINRPPVDVGPINTDHDDPNRISILTDDVPSFSAAYEQLNAVLFYNPAIGPGMTLVASLKEDHTTRTGNDALDFTLYKWYYLGQDGTAPTLGYGLDPDGTSKEVNVTPDANKHIALELTPGFHYFRVEGYIIPEGLDIDDELCTVQDEIFVVFVLPEMGVGVTHTGDDPTLFQYCEMDASDQENVVMTANVEYEDYTGNPDLDQFELKYTWYAVKSNATDVFAADPGDFPTIDSDKIDITGAAQQESAVEVSTSNVFTPSIADIGTYKFFVEVEYTIKDRNYDGSEVDPITDRARPYVIYRGWFGGADQDNASVVYVTPQPGKPHITIEAVND